MVSGLTIHQVLSKYWGYASFRPVQEDIIHSVLAGKDTLALLPTGGGKSVCFQVPGMILDGLTLVITPLIALMKDQVENLRKRGIPAEALYSGMSPREIDLALNHVMHKSAKFLYLSPERLLSQRFMDLLPSMHISLIAVDESHCISQWGYDFRPPYLRIAEIRHYLPGVPVLALTATATRTVVSDIQSKLGFRQHNVFERSFERHNLAYVVFKEEDKLNRLLSIVSKLNGSTIVYVRNRRKTREIADFLRKNGVNADFYHAGLTSADRERKQDAWKAGRNRIIVSTNAFGMGIDKADVRLVVHLDLPESIEAYFQEAGRAGRDENKAYAVLLYEEADILDARHTLELNYPAPDTIRQVYQALGNYFQLMPGTGKDMAFDFEISEFSNQYNLKPVTVYNALKFIEREGFIVLNEAVDTPSRILINVRKDDLYRFQVENARFDPIIKTILRSYGGVFTEPAVISEAELARRLSTTPEEIVKALQYLTEREVLTYLPRKSKPQLTFSSEFVRAADLRISPENYADRKKDAMRRLEAIIGYATSSRNCRSRSLVGYFGQTDGKRCGICDICLKRNRAGLSELDFSNIVAVIKPILKSGNVTMEALTEACHNMNEDKVVRAVTWLVDNDKILMSDDGSFRWAAE